MNVPQHDHRPMLAKDGMTGTGASGKTCRLRCLLNDSVAQAGFWALPVEVMVSTSTAKQRWKAMATVCLKYVICVQIVLAARPVWALDRRLCLDLAMHDTSDNREARLL